MQKLNIYYIGRNIYKGMKSATIEECYTYLKDKKIISLDIETTRKYGGKYEKEGLDPYLSKIVMLQIGDIDRQYIIDYRIVNIVPILALLTDPDITIVGQNLKFEYKHLLHNNNIGINNLYDTMVVEQILFNGLNVQASLKALNLKYLNIDVNKNIRLDFLYIKDRPFSYNEIEYGAMDILYPLEIRQKQLRGIKEKEVLNCVNLEMLFIPVLGDIEYKGMHFNKHQWNLTYEENLIFSKELELKLNNYIIEYYPDSSFIKQQFELFDTSTKCNVNWNSSKQVIELFRYLNICPQEVSKTTKKLSYTVNAKVVKASLKTFNNSLPDHLTTFVKMYLNYKESRQACTTFGIDFFKHINPITFRIHSNYKQILATGRISSNSPNLQNIPSDIRFRKAFDCPSGKNIVNADYSGQEQIILANKSQDPGLIHFYEQDLGDMHSFIASKIFPELSDVSLKDIKKYHKEKRDIAKAAGFAINYGGNGHTISKNLGITAELGDFVYDAYFKAFPGLNKYFDKIRKQSLKSGFILIDKLTGRKNWFISPKTPKEKGRIERASLNFPIQGEAGGITKYATILFRNWIIDNNLENNVFITNIVHDEINIECDEDVSTKVAVELEKAMAAAGAKWCKIIPLKADAAITKFWNH